MSVLSVLHVSSLYLLSCTKDTLPLHLWLWFWLGSVNSLCCVAAVCRGLGGDAKAEKQLVSLLSMPLARYNPVTVLSLDQYPPLMSLLAPRTHKDMAIKVVQTMLTQGTLVSSVDRVEMLFKFIAPLVEESADGQEEDELDEEVTSCRMMVMVDG